FASFRDIGLQQDPRLQDPARRALSFPKQRFKPFAFLAAQPHNILLYRNLLRSHDCLPRQSLATKANHKILSNWLKRATRSYTHKSRLPADRWLTFALPLNAGKEQTSRQIRCVPNSNIPILYLCPQHVVRPKAMPSTGWGR